VYRGRVACGGFLLLLGACSDGTGPAPPSGGAAAPTNLSAIGDITPNQVSLSWDTVSGAATYNIYWRASPGVTPANGSKITVSNPANAGAGRKGFLDSGRAAGTTYYVVTALGGAGESGPSNEAVVTLADGIGLSINQPQPGAFVADSVYFDVYVQSVFEVASVTAAVENRQVSLVF